MHSTTGGDYFLYVEISPQTRRMTRIIPHTNVRGNAHLCTPKGERFSLRLDGEMAPHLYLNTLGQPIRLGMDNWHALLPVGADARPSFTIWGTWGKGEIAAEDRKSLSHAFLPDGTLRPPGSSGLASPTEDIQVTLREGSYPEWEAACSTGSPSK